MTIEQRNAQRKEEAFIQECQTKAAYACDLLRKQLRDQEMARHIKGVYAYKGDVYTSSQQEFVFVSRKEVQEELEKRCQRLLDDVKTA